MAQRRMFCKEITESDAFREMPLSSQALYLHLGMAADDDGVVNNPRTIQRCIGASEDDLKILLAKRFILALRESGIVVIKHWRINNYIQKDRYIPSKYQKELEQLTFDENNAYTEIKDGMYPKCIQNVSIGKDSIVKDSKELDNNSSLSKKLNTTNNSEQCNYNGTNNNNACESEKSWDEILNDLEEN